MAADSTTPPRGAHPEYWRDYDIGWNQLADGVAAIGNEVETTIALGKVGVS